MFDKINNLTLNFKLCQKMNLNFQQKSNSHVHFNEPHAIRKKKKVLKASNNAVRARLQVEIKQTLSIQLEDERRDENKL